MTCTPARHDWTAIETALDREGWAVLPGLLSPGACAGLAATYDEDAPFRSTVTMARHGFGRGEYRYFAYPLPPVVSALRSALYPHLADIANRWHGRMGSTGAFPPRTTSSSRNAMPMARYGPRRCCCAMARATIIACIRTCMAIMSSRFRSRCCSRRRALSSTAASWC